jgi:hypothetical protein
MEGLKDRVAKFRRGVGQKSVQRVANDRVANGRNWLQRIEFVFLDNGTCTKAGDQECDENDPAHTHLPALLKAVGLFYLVGRFRRWAENDQGRKSKITAKATTNKRAKVSLFNYQIEGRPQPNRSLYLSAQMRA